MFADLYVTASTILKFNRRLETIEIGLRLSFSEISEKMGENIYENVMEGMEIHEEGKKRVEDATEELRQAKARLEQVKWEERKKLEERRMELQAKCRELAGYRNRVSTSSDESVSAYGIS